MAKVLGETARYVTKQSIKKYQREFIVINLASFFLALIIGFWLGLRLNKQAYLWIWIPIFIIALILFLTTQLTNRVTDKLERKRIDYRKGAVGEALVNYILAGFPDAYRVIPGVETSFGDIDHVVVGPTGVYAVDTKNWRGIVTADGEGELLLNGRPTKKPAIGNLTRSIMTTKKKIKVRSALDPYVRGVLAFPSARVEAKWGTTGSIHCITDEQLYDYIVEKKKRLTKKEIELISQAFLATARKDKDFAPDSR
jgi:hypothetical protein